MKWSRQARNSVERISSTAEKMIPLGFKDLVKTRMGDIKDEARKRAENEAKNRGSEEVTEEDLVEGLKKWIPPQYKGYLTEVLEKSGIDIDKYFKK